MSVKKANAVRTRRIRVNDQSLEGGLGFSFLGIASVLMTKFFLVHQRFETDAQFPALVVMAFGTLFIIGLGFKLAFFGWGRAA